MTESARVAAKAWALRACISAVHAAIITGSVPASNAARYRSSFASHSARTRAATVRGYAFAGHERGIARVDVSTDAGHRWTQADLDPASGPWAWRFWRTQLDLPPGDTSITVRAWDTTGACMPEDPAQLWNPKGYINNAWARVTVHAR